MVRFIYDLVLNTTDLLVSSIKDCMTSHISNENDVIFISQACLDTLHD